jgi:hypothetical protein
MPEDPIERDDDRPKIDVSSAVGEAGHEVEQLGYTGVADSGPVLEKPDESADDEEIEIDRIANAYPPD